MALRQFKHFWDSLTGKSVIYLTLALVVTIFFVTTVSILQGRDLLQSQVRQQLAVTANLIAGNLDSKLRVRFDAVNDVARSLRMPESELYTDPESARRRLLALSGVFDRVLLLDGQGALRAEWPTSGNGGMDLSTRDYFQATRDRLSPLISEPVVSPVTGKPTVNVTAPVFNESQRLIGVLVGSLQLDANTLIGGLQSLRIGETGYVGVATRDGAVLAHPDPGKIMRPLPADSPAFQMALDGFEGPATAMNLRNQRALYHFRQLDEAPWVVAVVLPVGEAYAPFDEFVSTAVWASLGLLLVLALLSWQVFRRLLAPLGDLAAQIVARHTGQRRLPVRAQGSAEIRHVAETFNTIFDQRAASLQQTQEREAFFRTLSENLPLGILQTDIHGRVTFLNPAFTVITGIGLREGTNRYWLDSLHAEDRDSVREAWLDTLAENRVFQSRFRINTTDGQVRWVEVVATTIDSAGSVLGYLASVRDVTQEHRVQELLEAERRRSNNILDTIAEGVILTELDGRIRYLNGPAHRYLATNGRILETRLFDHIDVQVGGQTQTAEALLQLARLENLDIILGNRRGEKWDLELTMLRSQQAEAEDQLVFVLRDDSERRRQEERLTWEATHDALTGLVNRRGFADRLNDQVRQASQGNGLAALILVDLDEFKPVNDQAGHLAGDHLLQELAQVMRQQVRQSDTVARLGGDEFALILPGCTLDRATALAETVRAAIADLQICHEGRQYGVTASLGVAIIRHGEETSRTLVDRADAACYAAKAKGRNRVEVGY